MLAKGTGHKGKQDNKECNSINAKRQIVFKSNKELRINYSLANSTIPKGKRKGIEMFLLGLVSNS